jgi:periplasmic mercuric ion binding protein
MQFRIFLIGGLLVLAGTTMSSALAATKAVTLDVPGMTCPICVITVQRVLSRVPGVGKVEVSYEARQAVVTYDNAKTTPGALTDATRNWGYPSTVKGDR